MSKNYTYAPVEPELPKGLKPYYQDEIVTLYHGDSRKLVGRFKAESCITDPVWPNGKIAFPHIRDAQGLLSAVLNQTRVNRVVVHLGCDSDPRFLLAVPTHYKFLRSCTLRYACPSYKGRLLYTGDMAYVFGVPPVPGPGKMILPGESTSTRSDKENQRKSGRNKLFIVKSGDLRHPSARRLEHVQWLAKWFAGSSVIDPFAGSGTTLLACKKMGIPCAGIEINKEYCAFAAERLAKEPL